MNVKVKRLHPDAILPHYDYVGDAGLAMYALEGATIPVGGRQKFDCGWALEFDANYVAKVFDRSSMGAKGLKTMGGVFDSNCRGEYNAILVNLSGAPNEVKKGDKVAQLVLIAIGNAEFAEVTELSASARSDKRFGSTGR